MKGGLQEGCREGIQELARTLSKSADTSQNQKAANRKDGREFETIWGERF